MSELRLTWPIVPEPWDRKQHTTVKYREGYRTSYREGQAKQFHDPTGVGAQAYFAGWRDGIEARDKGVQHHADGEVPVPEKFTQSGDTRLAFRGGYKVARALESLKPERRRDLYDINRKRFVRERTWGAATAFDAGWNAGLQQNPLFETFQAQEAGTLPPPSPTELPVLMPPPRPS